MILNLLARELEGDNVFMYCLVFLLIFSQCILWDTLNELLDFFILAFWDLGIGILCA